MQEKILLLIKTWMGRCVKQNNIDIVNIAWSHLHMEYKNIDYIEARIKKCGNQDLI